MGVTRLTVRVQRRRAGAVGAFHRKAYVGITVVNVNSIQSLRLTIEPAPNFAWAEPSAFRREPRRSLSAFAASLGVAF